MSETTTTPTTPTTEAPNGLTGAPTFATPRPCRWTVPCPHKEAKCGGFLLTPKGNASWKRGDFPASGTITATCSACSQEAVFGRPF